MILFFYRIVVFVKSKISININRFGVMFIGGLLSKVSYVVKFSFSVGNDIGKEVRCECL